jgi:hypothetical protein
MRFVIIIRRLFKCGRDLKDCVRQTQEAEQRRKPIVEPIRRKIEERRRQSADFVTNPNA